MTTPKLRSLPPGLPGRARVRGVEVGLHVVEARVEPQPVERRVDRVEAPLELLRAHVPGDVVRAARDRRRLAVDDRQQAEHGQHQVGAVAPPVLGIAGERAEAELILEADVVDGAGLVLRPHVDAVVGGERPAEVVLLELVAAVRVDDLDRVGQRVDVARVDVRPAEVAVAVDAASHARLEAGDRHAALDRAERARDHVGRVRLHRVDRVPVVVGRPRVEVVRAERPHLLVLRHHVRVVDERRALRHGARVGQIFGVAVGQVTLAVVRARRDVGEDLVVLVVQERDDLDLGADAVLQRERPVAGRIQVGQVRGQRRTAHVRAAEQVRLVHAAVVFAGACRSDSETCRCSRSACRGRRAPRGSSASGTPGRSPAAPAGGGSRRR